MARCGYQCAGGRGSVATTILPKLTWQSIRTVTLVSDERWFWTDIFQIPKPTFWAKEHAGEVAKARAEGLTIDKLAEQFGKARQTIRSALSYAAKADDAVRDLPKKMPRARWREDHAAEVAALKSQG